MFIAPQSFLNVSELSKNVVRFCSIRRNSADIPDYKYPAAGAAVFASDIFRRHMSNGKSFSGKAAIVTGATRGIGRATALELARRGADIAFNYAKSAEAAESLKSEI